MKSRVDRARRLLSGAGVTREDSDDELGLEDHPWEWIYAKEDGHWIDRIVGARMGTFQCMLGECVLLKAEGSKEAWVGLICDFIRDVDGHEKAANFMWFSSEKEIRNKQKKRADVMPNELYITPSWDINPLASINGKASIVSPRAFSARYPAGKVPRSSKDFGKIFVCRRGCNTRTATYTDDFVWEDVFRHGSEEDINNLVNRVSTQTNATRKRKRNIVLQDHEVDSANDSAGVPKTPSKRRKLYSAVTPRSKPVTDTPQYFITPTAKRVLVKKPLEFTPLGTRLLSPGHVASSPFQIARTKLHVSAVPTALPCREETFAAVYSHLEAAISDGSGSCIYISGTPGTGKTATVREVVAQLNTLVLAEELDEFIFVEINGMKVTDPQQSYSLLWEALRGDRFSPAHALDLLEREFSNPSPRRVPCVVLMDELDQLVTKNQSVMYNFFNWPSLRHSRLIVLAVANTMDLPERTLSNKISSRLGLTRITFPGYTYQQLMKIIQSRLEDVPGNIVDPDAVQFASRKVAAVSGDARRVLDICRRAVEIAEGENAAGDATTPVTPSRRGRAESSPSQGLQKNLGRVTISTIKQAIAEATSTPMQQYLKSLPLSSKLFLAAFLARIRRSGIADGALVDIIEEAKRLGQLGDNPAIRGFLFSETASIDQGPASANQQKVHVAPRVLAIGSAVVELMEAGIISIDPRKGERVGKIRLNLGEDVVKLALQEDSEVRGLGLSG
ncbi:MAG: hypothetical protein Q9187_000706 [Circinaria calcarea]